MMKILNRKPSPEIGERDLDCEFYDDCLNEAAQNAWDTFSCNDCQVYSGEDFDGFEDLESKEGNGMMKDGLESDESLEMKDTSQQEDSRSKPNKQKKDNTRRCECGKITLSANCPYCPSCMAKKANKKRKAAKKAGESSNKTSQNRKAGSTGKQKRNQLDREKNELSTPGKSIQLDFDGYEHLLNRIEQDAKQQIRTTGGQIIWILKNASERTKEIL